MSSSAKMFSQSNELYYTVEKHDISSSFFPFSPPTFQHDSNLHDILNPITPNTGSHAPVNPESTQTGGRRRTIRKDRHSKIYTAQGPRDRRMRLSLDVARKFFDLQDLLGFDKASKTVQWLLSMSKAAIKEVVGAASKCAVLSSSEGEEDLSTVSDNKGKSTSPVIAIENGGKAKNRIMRSRATVAKESREKARARARERTLEKKMMVRCGGLQLERDLKLSNCLDFVGGMEENCSNNCNQESLVSLFEENWDHMSGFTNNYVDEKVLVGDGLLQSSYGRTIGMPSMFENV